jgi:alcohol dehydrogenase
MNSGFFAFYCPVKVLSGNKALAALPYEMGLLGAKKALVVTDKGVVGAGLLKPLQDVMIGENAAIGCVYDATPVDSSNKACNEIAKLFTDHGCDCLIALGGGSCIDSAKGANIVLAEGAADLMQFQGMDRLTKPQKPLIVIPTTAGTGSEVTLVAVIKDVERNVKMPFVSDKLYPALAVLDPAMTLTMPAKITAATGMDALTHAIEAYVGLQKNPVSDAFAVAAIKLIFANLAKATENGKDETARLAMADAALLAGIAFSNSMVGVVHAMAHAVGAVCEVPHGVANAVLLPWGMEYNLGKVAPRLAELAGPVGLTNPADNAVQRARAVIQAVRELTKRLHEISGLPTTLREAGVPESQLERVARVAIDDGSCIYNPEEIAFEDALEILQKAY